MSYLLDTMIVSYFLQAGREKELAAAAKNCPMAIVAEVCGELKRDKHRGGRFFTKWLASSNIEVRSIVVGSPASATFALLLDPKSPDKNIGERASIALAASDASLTLVTHDKGGLWIALRELWMPGERILGLTPFLRRLFDQGAVQDHAVLDDVVSVAVEPGHRPTWWASWRGGLVSGESNGASPSPPGAPGAPQIAGA